MVDHAIGDRILRRRPRGERRASRLKPELLVGKHIFLTPIASRGELLVDDVFRQHVEAHKLKGLEFHAIPRVDEPGEGASSFSSPYPDASPF